MPDSSNPTPVYSSVSPSTLGLGGGTLILKGQNLGGINLVTIDGQGANSTTPNAAGTEVKAVFDAFPATHEGKRDIFAYNVGVKKNTDLILNIVAPTISSISPENALISGGMPFTITGSGLTGASEVLFGEVGVTTITVTETTITGTVPKGRSLGAVDIKVMVQATLSNSISFSYTLAQHVPLTIDTSKAGLPTGTEIYAYIVGGVKSGDGMTFYHVQADGTPVAMAQSDNTEAAGTFPNSQELSAAAQTALADNYKQAWADYSIPATDGVTIDLAKINTTNIPTLGTGSAGFSGRIYLSVGVPRLPFTVTGSGFAQPTSYGDSGQYCLFDWIEFSFDSLQNINANTTQVDGFGLSLTLAGTPQTAHPGEVTEVGLKQGFSRNDMVEVLAALFREGQVNAPEGTQEPGPHGKTAYPDVIHFNTGDVLRQLSPDAISAHPALKVGVDGYFDDEIHTWYTKWTHTPLVTEDVATGFYSAMANGDVLQFKKGNLPTKADWDAVPDIAFSFSSKITSDEIWQCDGVLASGDTAAKNAGKIIAAAFNRGIVADSLSDLTSSGSCNAAAFYPTGGVWNKWAALTHQYGRHHLAYGFPYDDVCNQNPTVAMSIPTEVTITLEKF